MKPIEVVTMNKTMDGIKAAMDQHPTGFLTFPSPWNIQCIFWQRPHPEIKTLWMNFLGAAVSYAVNADILTKEQAIKAIEETKC